MSDNTHIEIKEIYGHKISTPPGDIKYLKWEESQEELVRCCQYVAEHSDDFITKSVFERTAKTFESLFQGKLSNVDTIYWPTIRAELCIPDHEWMTLPIDMIKESKAFRSWCAHLLGKNIVEQTYFTPANTIIGQIIRNFLRSNNCYTVLEVGAGKGWWAKMLSTSDDLSVLPIKVTATDIFPQNNIIPVEGISSTDAIKKYATTHDALLTTSPVTDILETLKFWPKEKPILIISPSQLEESENEGYISIGEEQYRVIPSPQLSNLLLMAPLGRTPCLIQFIQRK